MSVAMRIDISCYDIKRAQLKAETPPASRSLAMNNFMLRVKTSRRSAGPVPVLELEVTLKSFPTAFCPALSTLVNFVPRKSVPH